MEFSFAFYELQNKQIYEEEMFNLLNKNILGTYCVPDTVPVNKQGIQVSCSFRAHILGKVVRKNENKGIKIKKKKKQVVFSISVRTKQELCVTETQGEHFRVGVRRCC